MTETLFDISREVDDIKLFIERYGFIYKRQLIEKVIYLQTRIKILQSMAREMADVSNMATKLIIKFGIDPVDVNVSPDSNTTQALNLLRNRQINKKEVSAKVVDNINQIPISNIYWVNDIQQFAININGKIIRGDVGNIIKESNKTMHCKHGASCKKLLTCTYFHDPEDYINRGLEVPANNFHNFKPGSFIYSKSARQIGNRDTLNIDLLKVQKGEIKLREYQLMHDLITYFIIMDAKYNTLESVAM